MRLTADIIMVRWRIDFRSWSRCVYSRYTAEESKLTKCSTHNFEVGVRVGWGGSTHREAA